MKPGFQLVEETDGAGIDQNEPDPTWTVNGPDALYFWATKQGARMARNSQKGAHCTWVSGSWVLLEASRLAGNRPII